MADILEPTNEEVRDAIDDLVAEGKAERIVIAGEVHIRLTQAGMDAAAEVVRRLGETMTDERSNMTTTKRRAAKVLRRAAGRLWEPRRTGGWAPGWARRLDDLADRLDPRPPPDVHISW